MIVYYLVEYFKKNFFNRLGAAGWFFAVCMAGAAVFGIIRVVLWLFSFSSNTYIGIAVFVIVILFLTRSKKPKDLAENSPVGGDVETIEDRVCSHSMTIVRESEKIDNSLNILWAIIVALIVSFGTAIIIITNS